VGGENYGIRKGCHEGGGWEKITKRGWGYSVQAVHGIFCGAQKDRYRRYLPASSLVARCIGRPAFIILVWVAVIS
jgi:hypothetical protein